MKKLIPIAFALIFIISSCGPLKHIPGYEIFMGVDFRPYSEKGFLITPHEYHGEFTSIYMIDYILMPEASYQPAQYEDNQKVEEGGWRFSYKDADIEHAVESIYNKCVEMGADAIMDFNIQTHEDEYDFIPNPVTVKGLLITGVAIKRGD